MNLVKSNILVPFYKSMSPENVKVVNLFNLYLALNANFKRSDIFIFKYKLDILIWIKFKRN